MIISEKQIMQLINKCKDYSVLLSLSNLDSAKERYNSIRDILDSIAHQQSEELKVIE